jgi:hypothetical protein
MPLQIRRGTDAERLAMIQPLAAGELVYVTDSQRLYIGNGTALGGVQITGYTNEDAIDAVGAALVAGSHTGGISFTYGTTQDNANRIDATVNISQLSQNLNLNNFSITGTGNININGLIRGDFKGSIVGDDSTMLVDAVDSAFNLDGTVKSNIVPNADTSRYIGSPTKRFNTLFLSNGISIGGKSVSLLNGNIDLPLGTTIGGDPLGAATLQGTNLNVNIIADDSTMIVNSSNASLHGLLYGSVAAEDSTLVVNHLDRTFSGSLGSNLGLNNYDITGNGNIDLRGFITNGTLKISGNTISSSEAFPAHLYVGDSIDPMAVVMIGQSQDPNLRLVNTTAAAVGSSMSLYTTRGTIASPTVLQATDYLGSIQFGGLVNIPGGGSASAGLAGIRAILDTVTDGSSNPTASIQLSVSNGPNPANSKVASLNASGVFTAPILKPSLYNGSGDYPATPQTGWIIFDDVTKHFMGYNGTVWKQLDN